MHTFESHLQLSKTGCRLYQNDLPNFILQKSVQFQKIEFRKHSEFSQHDVEAIKSEIIDQVQRRSLIENIYPYLGRKLFFAPKIAKKIYDVSYVEIVAERMRASWKLGMAPIYDVIDLFERNGIRVFLVDSDVHGKFDGLSAYVANQPIIVLSTKKPGCRQRFTLAHELGHFLLKDRLYGIEEEAACNRFAGAFLFPKEVVYKQLGKHRTMIELPELVLIKKEYGLSMHASFYRLKELKIITEDLFRKYVGLFQMNGWNKKEPGFQVVKEKAVFFTKLLFYALAEQQIDEMNAAKLMCLPINSFRKLRFLHGRGFQDDSGKAFNFYSQIRNS